MIIIHKCGYNQISTDGGETCKKGKNIEDTM